MIKRLTVFILTSLIIAVGFSQPAPTEEYLSYEIGAFAQGEADNYLTVFTIPSKVMYDWGSPHSLRRTFIKNYKRSLFNKEGYLLGHAFIELGTAYPGGDVFTGMRAESRKEQQEYVLRQYYGLSILGADLQGRLEKPERLKQKLEHFSRKGEMAFITVLINEEAARRMLEFYRAFSSVEDSVSAPCFHYSGAYWPRYRGEGAGCSAFAIAFLDLGGILREAYDKWKIEINIPRDLMGGPYNPGNEVRLRDIRDRHQWAGESEEYEAFGIYDPTYMYEWIQEHWKEDHIHGLPAKPVMIHGARGILIDARRVPAPADEPVFMERETPSIFVK